jgi:hypothetical protein
LKTKSCSPIADKLRRAEEEEEEEEEDDASICACEARLPARRMLTQLKSLSSAAAAASRMAP